MSRTITLDEALIDLREFIRDSHSGDEILITEDQKKVAKLIVLSQSPGQTVPRRPGLGKGSVLFMSSDFDEPLDEFSTETE